MDFKNLTKQQKQYLVLGLMVSGAVLYGLCMLIGGVLNGDAKSRAELLDLTGKIESAERALHGEARLRAKIVEAGKELDGLVGLMPEHDNEYVWAMEQISALIGDSGIHLLSLDPLAATAMKPSGGNPDASLLGFYGVRISAAGGYNQLRNFLTKVEKESPLISIQEVEVSANVASSINEHKLRIDLYWPTLPGKEGDKK